MQLNRTLTSILIIGGCTIAVGLFAKNDVRAQMQYPIDVAVGPDNTLYVADRKLPGIWKIADGEATVYYQADKRFDSILNAIRCVAVDADGHLLAGDSATFTVYRFDESDEPQPTHTGRIGIPMGIAAAPDGTIYVSDIELGKIVKIAPSEDGAIPEREHIASVAAPRGLWLDSENRLWIVSARPGQLRRLEVDGTITPVVDDMPFQYPSAVAVIDGTAYVCDSFADTIFKIDADGNAVVFSQGEPFVHPVGLSVDGGKIVVADSRANKIFNIDSAGTAAAIELRE